MTVARSRSEISTARSRAVSYGRSSHSTVNSSPPNRATVSPGRITASSLRGDRDEELVAGVVAQAVVDVLEAVEVEEHDADARLRALAARDRLTQPVEEQQTIREPGERIVHRLVRELFLERLALDGDRRELREQEEDLPVLVVGEARLGRRTRRAFRARRRRRSRRSGSTTTRGCRARCATSRCSAQRSSVGDVAHEHRLAERGGRAARDRGRPTPGCRRATSRKRRREGRRGADAQGRRLGVEQHDRARETREVAARAPPRS